MPGGRPIRPRGGGGPGNRKRRVVIDGGGGRPGAGQRQRPGDRSEPRQPKTPREVVPPSGPVTVESGVTLRDFSQALGTSVAELIKLLAAELKREVTIKHAADDEPEPESFDDPDEVLEDRPPVVTIMGHVDHG